MAFQANGSGPSSQRWVDARVLAVRLEQEVAATSALHTLLRRLPDGQSRLDELERVSRYAKWCASTLEDLRRRQPSDVTAIVAEWRGEALLSEITSYPERPLLPFPMRDLGVFGGVLGVLLALVSPVVMLTGSTNTGMWVLGYGMAFVGLSASILLSLWLVGRLVHAKPIVGPDAAGLGLWGRVQLDPRFAPRSRR